MGLGLHFLLRFFAGFCSSILGTVCLQNLISSVDIVKQKMEAVLGNIEVELDGRFRSIRTQETNLGKLKL